MCCSDDDFAFMGLKRWPFGYWARTEEALTAQVGGFFRFCVILRRFDHVDLVTELLVSPPPLVGY